MKKLVVYFGIAMLMLSAPSFAQEIDITVDPVGTHPDDTKVERDCEKDYTYIKYFKSKHCYCKGDDIPDLKAAKEALLKDIVNTLKCINTCDTGFYCKKKGPFKLYSKHKIPFDPIMEEMNGPDGGKMFCTYYSLQFEWGCTLCERKPKGDKLLDEHGSGYLTVADELVKMQFRPNPSDGRFSVLINIPKEVNSLKLLIRDVSGKVILSKRIIGVQGDSRFVEVDISEHVNGIYMASLFADDALLETRKIIIEQ